MRSLTLGRYALSVCVTATLFAGCGGSQIAGFSSAQQFANSAEPKSAASRLSGGAFSASYSGKDGGHACGTGCHVTIFRGSGTAKFLRSSYERVSIKIVDGTFTGRAILKSLRSKTDSITATVSPNSNGYTVTGGTGRFTHATGSGTISRAYYPKSYTDTWTGTLYF